jgi:hypothetical protein
MDQSVNKYINNYVFSKQRLLVSSQKVGVLSVFGGRSPPKTLNLPHLIEMIRLLYGYKGFLNVALSAPLFRSPLLQPSISC